MNLPGGIALLGLIAYGLLAWLVLRRAPGARSRAQELFLVYLAFMALWQITALAVSLAREADSALVWYAAMSAVVLGQFVIYLAFVRALLHSQRHPHVATIGLALWFLSSLVIAANRSLVITGVVWNEVTDFYLPVFGPWATVVGLPNYLFLIYTILLLDQGRREAQTAIERSRIQYLSVGLGLVVGGTLANFVPVLKPYPLDVVANIANALLIGYAILRYRLLDITVVARKGLLYSIPAMLLGASYFVVVYLAVNLLHLVTGYEVFLLSVAMAAVAALALQPLWSWMQAALDRFLFRDKHDASRMLQKLSREAATVLELEPLADLIVAEIVAGMKVKSATLLVAHEGTQRFEAAAQRGIQGDWNSLRADHPIIGWLAKNQDLLTRQQLDVAPQFRSMWLEEREALERVGSELFVPLLVYGRLVGVLALGPKRGEIPYSQDEQLTLATLANQTAVAIENSRLYESVRRELAERRRAEAAALSRSRELAALLEIVQAISSTLDLSKQLSLIAQRTAQACSAERCSLFLLDQSGNRLQLSTSQFADARPGPALAQAFEEQSFTKPPEQSPLIEALVTERKTVVLDREAVAALPLPWSQTFGASFLLAAPLVSQDQFFGLLVLDRTRPEQGFSHEQSELAETIAGQVAVALKNAQLFQATMAEKEQTERIVEEAFAGIILLDADLEILMVNPGAAEMIGYPAADLVGRCFPEVSAAELWAEGSLLAQAQAGAPQAAPAEAVLAGREGFRDILLAVTPVRDGYLLNFADVTKIKEAERLKASLVANVSHELRAPLASIKAYTELLLDNLEGEDKQLRQQFLSVIDREADWLTELINDLLDLARLESGKFTPRREWLSIGEIMGGVVAMTEAQAQKKRVKIEENIVADLPLLYADKELLTIMVKNLLSNAVKFNRDGGRVEVNARREDAAVVLEVVDEGIGMAVDDLPRLFSKFFRSEVVRDAQIRGTGLGLTLVKEAVEKHGGTVTVESQLGVGSRFRVVLPIPNDPAAAM